MNIAVSVPYRPKFSSVAQQMEAERQERLRRRQANAFKPKLIEAPKPVARVNGFRITVDCNSHVMLYRIFRSAIDKFNELHAQTTKNEKTRLEMRDVQLFVLANTWSVDETLVKINQFKIGDLNGKSRIADVVLARQIAMYICRELLTDEKGRKKSYPVIGRHFGGRDHTTALHANIKIQNLILNRQLLMNGEPFKLERIGEI